MPIRATEGCLGNSMNQTHASCPPSKSQLLLILFSRSWHPVVKRLASSLPYHYHFYSLVSSLSFLILKMPGVVVTSEPELENEWHPIYNPFRRTIVVEE